MRILAVKPALSPFRPARPIEARVLGEDQYRNGLTEKLTLLLKETQSLPGTSADRGRDHDRWSPTGSVSEGGDRQMQIDVITGDVVAPDSLIKGLTANADALILNAA